MSPISSSIKIIVSMNTKGIFHKVGWVYYDQWFDEYVLLQQIRLNYRVKIHVLTIVLHRSEARDLSTVWHTVARSGAATHTAPVVIYSVFSKRPYFMGYQITLSPFYFYFPVKMFNARPHNFGHKFKDDRRYRQPSNLSYSTHVRVVVKSDDLDILDHESLWTVTVTTNYLWIQKWLIVCIKYFCFQSMPNTQ